MLGKHPSEVRDPSVKMVLDSPNDYPSVSAAAKNLGPKSNVEAATLCRWVMQARTDAAVMPGATTEQLAEMARLKKENAEWRETN